MLDDFVTEPAVAASGPNPHPKLTVTRRIAFAIENRQFGKRQNGEETVSETPAAMGLNRSTPADDVKASGGVMRPMRDPYAKAAQEAVPESKDAVDPDVIGTLHDLAGLGWWVDERPVRLVAMSDGTVRWIKR